MTTPYYPDSRLKTTDDPLGRRRDEVLEMRFALRLMATVVLVALVGWLILHLST